MSSPYSVTRSTGATLLEKRRNMFEVQEVLDRERRRFAEKEEEFRAKEEALKAQEHQLQISVVKFGKFNMDNENKRKNANATYTRELDEIEKAESQIERLREDKIHLNAENDRIIRSLQKYLKYADFLESVKSCDALPAGMDVKARYEALEHTSLEQLARQDELRAEYDALRQQHQAYLKEKTSQTMASTTEVAELQKQLESLQKRRASLQSQLEDSTSVESDASVNLQNILDAIDNLFARCRTRTELHHHQQGLVGKSRNPLFSLGKELHDPPGLRSPSKLAAANGASPSPSAKQQRSLDEDDPYAHESPNVREILEAFAERGLANPQTGAINSPRATRRPLEHGGVTPLPPTIEALLREDERNFREAQQRALDLKNPAAAAIKLVDQRAAEMRRKAQQASGVKQEGEAQSPSERRQQKGLTIFGVKAEELDPNELAFIPTVNVETILTRRTDAASRRLDAIAAYLNDFKDIVSILDGKKTLDPDCLLTPNQLAMMDKMGCLSLLSPAHLAANQKRLSHQKQIPTGQSPAGGDVSGSGDASVPMSPRPYAASAPSSTPRSTQYASPTPRATASATANSSMRRGDASAATTPGRAGINSPTKRPQGGPLSPSGPNSLLSPPAGGIHQSLSGGLSPSNGSFGGGLNRHLLSSVSSPNSRPLPSNSGPMYGKWTLKEMLEMPQVRMEVGIDESAVRDEIYVLSNEQHKILQNRAAILMENLLNAGGKQSSNSGHRPRNLGVSSGSTQELSSPSLKKSKSHLPPL